MLGSRVQKVRRQVCRFDWWMGPRNMKAGWRRSMKTSGARSVMTNSTTWTPPSSAGCSVCPLLPAIRVESCMADNRQTGDNLETLKIIDNSCPSSEIGKLMREKPTRSPDTTKVTFQLQPWMFNKFLDISVSCTVKVCPMGQTSSCDPTNCDGGGDRFGRKRRSLNVSDEYVRKSFSIRKSSVTHPTRKSESLEETDDVKLNVTTLIAAGIAMVIIMMLVITIVVILLLRMKRSKRNSKVQDVCQQKQAT
ncbi:uncharacterized protein LOC121385549 isoform X3 [Gigantopelta aegis]|uniref:uncharacterized protein LOC121385549 isoform X3 n=1 Tax=Gigantopelta aegis TaxID=1735272 RepID=UPI001B88BC2B|nr:uncharacterized protein LOC121385549 isoform X3 [Gigantopelta aegis]